MKTSVDPLISLEECNDLAHIMDIKYAASLNGRFFAIKVEKENDWVLVTVVLKNEDESFYYPVEARVHKEVQLSSRDAALFLLDYIDVYFEEYLHESDVYLPIDWAQFQHEGVDFHLRGQILDLVSQRQADALLHGEKQL